MTRHTRRCFIYLSQIIFCIAHLSSNSGCGEKLAPVDSSRCSATIKSVTYKNGAAAFFSQYCLRCHSSTATERHGAPADYNYDTFAGAHARATEIREQVTARLMPYDNPLEVTQNDRCLIQAWVDGGALE